MFEQQVRQLYVAKARVASNGTISTEGDIKLMKTPDGKKIYFQFKDKGGVSCTDQIEIDKIRNINVCKPKGLAMHKHVVKVDESLLDATTGNEGNMIPGETYGLHIVVKDWGGIDTYRMKDAFVLGKKGMTTVDFYEKMAESFKKQFTTANDLGIFSVEVAETTVGGITFQSTEAGKKVTVDLDTTAAGNSATYSSGTLALTINHATNTTVDDVNTEIAKTSNCPIKAVNIGTVADASTATEIETGLIITETAPLYKQDLVKMIPTNAEISTDSIMVNGVTEHWGTVAKSVSSFTGNARKTAEWERFYMRARGENDGWLDYPYCDPAELMIQNPGINDNFWYLNIQYFFRGEGMVNTDSPKDMTIVVSTALETSTGILSTAAALDALSQDTTYSTSSNAGSNKLMNDIITATGKSILFKYIA